MVQGHRQRTQEAFGAEGLVVARKVQHPRRHVHRITKAISIHIHQFTQRRRNFQPEHRTFAGIGTDALEGLVHFIGGRQGAIRDAEHGHQSVAQGLDDPPAIVDNHLPKQGDALGHHQCRLGIAQLLVQRGAATQVGEQDSTCNGCWSHRAGGKMCP